MTSPAQSVQRDAVSPLELFFDLVFVFAVSQLSHHLLDHLSWRGAAETLVLLIAVFGIWSGTSFEATLLHIARSQARWLLLAVMLVGLFMNAAVQNAFETGGWAFVIPLLMIQAGRSILMVVVAPTRMLREHYGRLLCWIIATTPLWIVGAIADAESRLLWWSGAAVIDLAGTWLAHPLPGRMLRSEHVEFDANHMLERCRLFLIIALGESVLSSGTAPRRRFQDPADGGDRHLCLGDDRRVVGAAFRRLGSPHGPLCRDHGRSDLGRSKDGERPVGLGGRTDRRGGGQRAGHRAPPESRIDGLQLGAVRWPTAVPAVADGLPVGGPWHSVAATVGHPRCAGGGRGSVRTPACLRSPGAGGHRPAGTRRHRRS